MSNVYACVGRYASNPFTIKNVGVRVYCVEELCYYIRNNALFIEDDFFDAALFSWLEDECDLLSLSRKIKVKLRTDGRVENVVKELFDNVAYCSEEETEETIVLLKSNREMSAKERLKIHGDYFLNNDKLSLAAETYHELLHLLDKRKDAELRAKVYYNLGVIYARLFLFENAANYFKDAYEIDHSQESMVAYLMTLRNQLSDDVYLKKLQGIEGAYDCSAIVENEYEKALNDYKESSIAVSMKEVQKLKLEGNVDEFNNRALKLTSKCKEDYRYRMQK